MKSKQLDAEIIAISEREAMIKGKEEKLNEQRQQLDNKIRQLAALKEEIKEKQKKL